MKPQRSLCRDNAFRARSGLLAAFRDAANRIKIRTVLNSRSTAERSEIVADIGIIRAQTFDTFIALRWIAHAIWG